jgi:hypothetical protein
VDLDRSRDIDRSFSLSRGDRADTTRVKETTTPAPAYRGRSDSTLYRDRDADSRDLPSLRTASAAREGESRSSSFARARLEDPAAYRPPSRQDSRPSRVVETDELLASVKQKNVLLDELFEEKRRAERTALRLATELETQKQQNILLSYEQAQAAQSHKDKSDERVKLSLLEDELTQLRTQLFEKNQRINELQAAQQRASILQDEKFRAFQDQYQLRDQHHAQRRFALVFYE